MKWNAFYSSFSLCFFGCRMIVVVVDDDEGVVEGETAVSDDDVCWVDGCNGRRARFLVEFLFEWTE